MEQRNEPSTGEIVQQLRVQQDSRWDIAADRLESLQRTVSEKDAQIASLTARAESAEAERDAAINRIEYDYSIGCICNQCELGNEGSCHHTKAFFGCGFKYDRRGKPQEGDGK